MTAAVTDFTQYTALRAAAADNAQDPELLREVAGQFESLFVQTLLRNMREASLAEPLFGNSERHDMYLDLLDQQLAVEVSKDKGLGLADVLVRQLAPDATPPARAQGEFLAGQRPKPDTTLGKPPKALFSSPFIPGVRAQQSEPGAASISAEPAWSSSADFVRDIWPHAEKAAAALGVDTRAVVAQAALESGWGKHVMSHSGGQSSFNLFGIKAGADWSGDHLARSTVEYRDGIAHREVARFRAYDSLEAGFDDYVAFLTGRERYADVLNSDGDGRRFAEALENAGYATDPHYAAKIERVMLGDTLNDAVSSLKNAPYRPKSAMAAMTTAP